MSLSTPSLARVYLQIVCIIGALAAAVAMTGCSFVRTGYNTAPTLAYWWLDSYFDFDGTQSMRIREDLQATLDWHRKEELPLLIQTLKDLQAMAPKPVTAEQVCQQVTVLQTRLQSALDHVVPSIAAIAPNLKAAQVQHVSQEFDNRNRKWREEWLEGTLQERTDRRVKQIVDRAEAFYGPLNPAQLGIVRAHIDASTFDGPRQYREMERRHADALKVLTELRTTKVTPAAAVDAIRGLLERTLKAPDPQYRQYLDHLTSDSCAAMAVLHNSSTAEQRAKLVRTLQDYEEDARALASQPSVAAPDRPSTKNL